MMVHFQYTPPTYWTVVRSVGLDEVALLTISHHPIHGSTWDRKVLGKPFQHLPLIIFAEFLFQVLSICWWQVELLWNGTWLCEYGLPVWPSEHGETGMKANQVKYLLDHVVNGKQTQLDDIRVVGPGYYGRDEQHWAPFENTNTDGTHRSLHFE